MLWSTVCILRKQRSLAQLWENSYRDLTVIPYPLLVDPSRTWYIVQSSSWLGLWKSDLPSLGPTMQRWKCQQLCVVYSVTRPGRQRVVLTEHENKIYKPWQNISISKPNWNKGTESPDHRSKVCGTALTSVSGCPWSSVWLCTESMLVQLLGAISPDRSGWGRGWDYEPASYAMTSI